MTDLTLNPDWEFVADTVMGGVSSGTLSTFHRNGRKATRLTGRVSLENNGGFVQMAFNLQPDGGCVDVSAYSGVEIDILGNDEAYDLRLRTSALSRPWQSYRASFTAPSSWQTIQVPFKSFHAHKTDVPMDISQLRRIGILAIGREFNADIAVSGIRLYD